MVVAATIANRIAHLFVAHIVPDIAFSCYAIITIFLGLSLIEIAGYVCLRFSKCGSAAISNALAESRAHGTNNLERTTHRTHHIGPTSTVIL